MAWSLVEAGSQSDIPFFCYKVKSTFLKVDARFRAPDPLRREAVAYKKFQQRGTVSKPCPEWAGERINVHSQIPIKERLTNQRAFE